MLHAVGASDRLVGVTLNDNYPPSVSQLPKVGDQTIDLEKVMSLEPDLVVLDSAFRQNKQTLQELDIQVLELNCERLRDVPQSLLKLGDALGLQESARIQAEAFEKEVAAIQPLSEEQTIFIEVWGSPLMTVGSDSLINDMVSVLGLKNSYADQKDYFQVDPEDVLSRKPEIVLSPAQKDESSSTSRAFEMLEEAGQSPRFVAIDADLFFRPGPRLIEGMKELRRQLEKPH
jgi:iron complex transport system substrate-binding protein